MWPLLREILSSQMRAGARMLVADVVEQRGSPYSPRVEVFMMGLSVYGRLIGRFVTSSMASPLWILFVALVQAFQEIAFRQSADRRDKCIARYIQRQSEEQIAERLYSVQSRRFVPSQPAPRTSGARR